MILSPNHLKKHQYAYLKRERLAQVILSTLLVSFSNEVKALNWTRLYNRTLKLEPCSSRTFCTILELLTLKGLIIKKPNLKDTREKLYYLSNKGLQVFRNEEMVTGVKNGK